MSIRQGIQQIEQAPFFQMLNTSTSLGWQHVHLYHYRLRYHEPSQVYLPHDMMVLHLKETVQLQRRFEGKLLSGISTPGKLSLLPRGSYGDYTWSGTPTCVAISLPSFIFAELAQDFRKSDHVEIQEKFNFEDLQLEQFGRKLLSHLLNGGLWTEMAVETLAYTMGLHLLRGYSTLSDRQDTPTHHLSKYHLCQVEEYIYANLSQRILVRDLAKITGLSTPYFAFLFKNATGYSPKQYLLRCRLEVAYNLLSYGHESITEIAHKVGFFDHSHFNYHIKRYFGVTPKIIRLNSKKIQKTHQFLQESLA